MFVVFNPIPLYKHHPKGPNIRGILQYMCDLDRFGESVSLFPCSKSFYTYPLIIYPFGIYIINRFMNLSLEEYMNILELS